MNALLAIVLVLGLCVAYYLAGVMVSFTVQTRFRKPYDFPDWDSLVLTWPAVLPSLLRDAWRRRARATKRR